MKNSSCPALFCSISSLSLLAGCATPFGQDATEIDWSARPRAGTITISDPKMYRREALIDERRKDVDWIDGLIRKSEDAPFKPEMLREIETITAVSAALGLKFDPTSALSYKQAGETGELKQEIDTLKLQLQLEQLRRDAELARQKFATQVDLVNGDLGKLSADPAVTGSSGVSAADQLKAAIDRLTVASYDFNKEVKGAAAATVSVSPLDDFRDRQAYRDLLKSARNAASLDELHDSGGSALIRLNFQATVIPDVSKSRAPGVVQMRVVAPEAGPAIRSRFYRGWLNYVNELLNRVTKDKDQVRNQINFELLQGAVSDSFEIVYYLYAGGTSPDQCRGIVSADVFKREKTACSALVFVAPRYLLGGAGTLAYTDFSELIRQMSKNSQASEDSDDLLTRQRIATVSKDLLIKKCEYGLLPPPLADKNGVVHYSEANKLQDAIVRSQQRIAAGDYYLTLDRTAKALLHRVAIDLPEDASLQTIHARTVRAQIIQETFAKAAFSGCGPEARDTLFQNAPSIYLAPWAEDTLWNRKPRVAIYEIGPREQVQQMSTVARSANSLGLALSIAASAPGSGAAGEAALGYSRQAMGRAETLERLPTAVGYSVSDMHTFGWVLGPRATVNPKGKIDLQQGLRTYDLTVDLSLPAWWPEFYLEPLTAWAPNRSKLVSGEIVLEKKPSKAAVQIEASRRIRVPMPSNDADYAAFTSLLAWGGVEPRREALLPTDEVFRDQKVSACRASTIILRGPLLWRASTVLVGGVKLNGSTISVLPDMGGIMVDVPALDEKIVGGGTFVQVSVLTPYGPSATSVTYDPKPEGGCGKPEAKPDRDTPTISKYEPVSVQLPGPIPLSVEGEKLEKIKRVTLAGIPAKILSQTDKLLTLEFPEDKTKVLTPSLTTSLVFFFENAKKEEKRIEKTLAIISNAGDK